MKLRVSCYLIRYHYKQDGTDHFQTGCFPTQTTSATCAAEIQEQTGMFQHLYVDTMHFIVVLES